MSVLRVLVERNGTKAERFNSLIISELGLISGFVERSTLEN
jgi:hypothetical protein